MTGSESFIQAKSKTQSTNNTDPDAQANPTTARHSSTSGASSAPSQKRTWSIPEADDEPGSHRGGLKHAKEKKRGKRNGKARDLGTGVNAIPVG